MPAPPVVVPDTFRAALAGRPADAPGGPDGDAWLRRLPGLVEEHLAGWRLAPDGPARHGVCALVVPVRREDGSPAALKITWPHREARHEHLALRLWDGEGAVRLLAADPGNGALLLERLDPDADLTRVGILEACDVLGDLARRLDRPADVRLDALETRTSRWRPAFRRGTPGVPRRLTQQAASALDDLLADPVPARLVHSDLHFANVLAPLPAARAERGAWLAIDPKPVAGEWAFAVAPVVWNRAADADRATSLRAHVRLRADVVADAAGLDPERVRLWTFVRLVLDAVDLDADGAGPGAGGGEGTRLIALAKAFAS